MVTGVLIGVVSLLGVLAIYFWIARPVGREPEQK
jgi:hypothetical protein